jgi:Bacterial RNA polymerase, alpha chain C terminal domain
MGPVTQEREAEFLSALNTRTFESYIGGVCQALVMLVQPECPLSKEGYAELMRAVFQIPPFDELKFQNRLREEAREYWGRISPGANDDPPPEKWADIALCLVRLHRLNVMPVWNDRVYMTIDEVLHHALRPREERVLRHFYGIGVAKMSAREIPKHVVVGVSASRIHQIKNQAIRKLQHPSRAWRYESFYTPLSETASRLWELEDDLGNMAKQAAQGNRAAILSALLTPVADLELSMRTWNSFANANIIDAGGAILKGERELLRSKNFGKKCLGEVKEVFAALGLTFDMKIDNDILEEYKVKSLENARRRKLAGDVDL